MTRFGYVMTTYFAALGFAVLVVISPGPKFIWNASASVPVGLYVLHPVGKLQVGDLVAVMPPKPLAVFLDQRRYLPIGVPMLKHVAALPGQKVCRLGRKVTVDGKAISDALDRDRFSRPLPVWHGCRVIAAGDVFLLNARWDSLDGRYFGPLPIAAIMGRADAWGSNGGDVARQQPLARVCPR
jgi:conjugative transfer signal peptidase TraF